MANSVGGGSRILVQEGTDRVIGNLLDIILEGLDEEQLGKVAAVAKHWHQSATYVSWKKLTSHLNPVGPLRALFPKDQRLCTLEAFAHNLLFPNGPPEKLRQVWPLFSDRAKGLQRDIGLRSRLQKIMNEVSKGYALALIQKREEEQSLPTTLEEFRKAIVSHGQNREYWHLQMRAHLINRNLEIVKAKWGQNLLSTQESSFYEFAIANVMLEARPEVHALCKEEKYIPLIQHRLIEGLAIWQDIAAVRAVIEQLPAAAKMEGWKVFINTLACNYHIKEIEEVFTDQELRSTVLHDIKVEHLIFAKAVEAGYYDFAITIFQLALQTATNHIQAVIWHMMMLKNFFCPMGRNIDYVTLGSKISDIANSCQMGMRIQSLSTPIENFPPQTAKEKEVEKQKVQAMFSRMDRPYELAYFMNDE
ncbi:MAG: hypothetical protein S4CHLAM102_08370 [Chlamydiia bacterium]|nr:hypothetical protein [Chlamydiia bacterium]